MTELVTYPKTFVDAMSALAIAGQVLAHVAATSPKPIDPLIARAIRTVQDAEAEYETVYRRDIAPTSTETTK